MKYEIDKINHQDWLNKGPWFNTPICSRLHGSMFEDFITHARIDRLPRLLSAGPNILSCGYVVDNVLQRINEI